MVCKAHALFLLSELLCVKYVLESFGNRLSKQSVLWHSDNVNVSRIIEAGSRKLDLQQIAIDIYDLCLKYNLILHATWVPREENQLADAISKISDTDNWSIDNESFAYIQNV